MPSGCHLSAVYLQQIWFGRVILQQDHSTIFENIFRDDPAFISEAYLKKLCSRCDSGEYDQQFLGVKMPRCGGPQNIIDGFDEFIFLNILVDCPQSTLKRAREVMSEDHYDQVYSVPSIRSFGRVLKKRNVSRKVLERVHHLQCPIKRGDFMDSAAPFHGARFVDIDESLSTQKEFFQRYGYAPKGERALKTQF
jgi:hypothetical protein